MTKKRALIPVALAGILMVHPAAAQDTSFKIYGAASYVSPLGEEDVSIGGITDSVETSNEVGWNAGLEFRLSEHFGIEVDYLNVTEDVDFGGTTVGEVDLSPLSASLDMHLIHTTLIDLYVAPTFSYVNWGNVRLNSNGSGSFGGSELGTDSDTAWGASIGLDVGLGRRVALTGGLRWLNLDLKPDGGGKAEVNPLFSRVGLALRW